MKLVVSLAQMDIALGQVALNLATARTLVAEAASCGSHVVVLPELWSTGYDLENASSHATPVNEGIFAQTAALAAEFEISIVGSCLSALAPDRYGNTAVFFGPDGSLLAEYTKLHLFRLMDEDKHLTPGDRSSVVVTPWGLAALAICYDLRFPELFRVYALGGARIIFLPSEWPQPRLAHWRTLLQARAIENQVFIVACNRVGQTGNDDFFGHSAIINPWGEIVIEAGQEQTLITAEIDLADVDHVRARIPVFDDRRPDVY